MDLKINGVKYPVVIEKKMKNRNTYIRVTKDLEIKVTTNFFSTNRYIVNLLEESYSRICDMLEVQLKKKENNTGFFYLGKKYEVVYKDIDGIEFIDNRVFMSRDFDIYKWYKKQAKVLFLEHLNKIYDNYSIKLPKPSLRIRKMTSRWGVCNIKTHIITINLELIKRDTKYLDYVITHEIAHLKHGDHSSRFWALVEDNMPDYKKYKEEMKEF